jgi:exodeoxyribonuclease V alpha subunit
LHSALKIKKKEDFHKEQYLFKDLIVVDECSMIDLHLWRVLLSAIQEGTRVVLMGDHDQLPPVETGMIFEQLMKVLPCSYLKKCMRTERQELLKLAEAIREKKEFVLEECLRRNTEEIQYYEYEREQRTKFAFVSIYVRASIRS